MKNILVTGRPGVGKTTLIKKIIKDFELDAGGFYTQEARKGGIRQGFEIVTLSGKRGTLASVNFNSPYRVGKYGVNLRDLEEVAGGAIEEALEKNSFLVIDEIGKMELFSEKFIFLLKKALESSVKLLGVIKLKDNQLTSEIKNRPDTVVYTLDRANFHLVEEKIKRDLGDQEK
ncbi:MAG: Nucleoside-triphosphatase THEP1 [candidate division WS2 bacterium]|uniref:Nucleoside-triphosphatase THEP1 n=1 Tax=Psychracetigena formicireducens TaxID=2986056 RepID=A0A9E2BH91_PSYF1|nr:Nucleoside-triphosphatase THEP1 [Candidatus Psychracetigena formicireducens]MBT9146594.1 Nucleoside-triphosphatase THEP1 [Bacillota bacterium]